MMFKCHNCNYRNPASNDYCFSCGIELPTWFERLHRAFLAVWVILIGLLLFLIPDALNQSNEVKISNLVATPAPLKNTLPVEVDPNAVYHVEVAMPDGSSGVFDIYILDKKYVWQTGSETIIEGLGNMSIKDRWKSAFSESLQELIKKAPEIVVVGTADVRSGAGGEQREVSRAGRRSRTLLQVVTDIRGNGQTAFNLNLGQWKGSVDVPFEDQRRIILIGIARRSDNLILKDGLRAAFEKEQTRQPIFNDMLSSYSKSGDFEIR